MLITHDYIKGLLGRRPKESHKGSNGRGLLIAGSPGMYGAAVMSACAAQRAGIGTLKVYCPEGCAIALGQLPEVMAVSNGCEGWEGFDADRLEELLAQCSCLAIGPGLGVGRGQEQALLLALSAGKPTVIDADGLNTLARISCFDRLHGAVALTPHLGEMARLTGRSIEEIAAAPDSVAAEMAERWGCTLLLKGAESRIAAPGGRMALNRSGNPGLAKGGSGDLLTGIILAMLGQGLPPFEAACAGAYLLGASADRAVDILHERMLMARDVAAAIEDTLNGGFCGDGYSR